MVEVVDIKEKALKRFRALVIPLESNLILKIRKLSVIVSHLYHTLPFNLNVIHYLQGCITA